MPALDDYAPPAPLWLVTLASVLELDGGAGVAASSVAVEVARRMPGRFTRLSSVFDVCRRMAGDGMLRVVRVVPMGNVRATFYALTDIGADMFFEARTTAALAVRLRELEAQTTKRKRRAT